MTRVIGVRFRTAGRIYFFDPLNFAIKKGDHVIVETARGIEYGTAASGITEVEEEKETHTLQHLQDKHLDLHKTEKKEKN